MLFGKKTKDKSEEKKRIAELREEKLSAKDVFAMLFSAFFVIVLPCILIVLVLALIVMFMFGAI